MHTGAMIALAPADPEALALAGGEPAEELHVTLFFLGDAEDIPEDLRQAILAEAEARAADLVPVDGRAFGAAVWNPDGDDPCVVLNVGGEGLVDARDEMRQALVNAPDNVQGEAPGWEMPEQHAPWCAHLCLAYSDDPAALIPAALERIGPVALDRVRVAFAGEMHDFPLGAASEPGDDDGGDETETDDDTTEDETAMTAATGPTGGRAMRRWSGVIAREGVQTGDGRVFAEGALYWEGDGPWPLRWDIEDDGMHLGAVTVGNVETIERRDGGVIWGAGTIDDTEGSHGADAVRLLENGMLRGVSIDPDDWAVTVIDTTITEAELEEAEAELMAMLAGAGDPDPGSDPDAGAVLFEDEAGAIVERFTRARIRGLTLVDIPAFADAEITLEPDDSDEADDAEPEPEGEDAMALVAAVVGATDLPVADRDTTWDGDSAASRVFEACTDGDTVDPDCVARAFLWRDDDADPTTQAAYSLGFADIIDGELRIVPAGVFATAGGRGVDALEGVSDEDRDRIRARICTLYERLAEALDDDEIQCPFDAGASDGDGESEGESEAAATTASSTRDGSHGCSCGGTCGTCQRTVVVAAGGPALPPADWFTDPQLTGPTPLTVNDDGRVFGHIATWGTCHTGSTAGSCVTPPRSAANYAYFRTGVRETTGGDVPVGQITLGGGHADLHLSYRGAIEHYDDVATAVADVAAGEDAHGIWVAGALRPGVTDEEILALRAASPSGDWRNIGGQLELVAAHAVNSPGFPVARVASGRPLALVASGAMAPSRGDDAEPEAPTAVVDTDAVADAVMRRLDQREAAPHRRKLAALGAEHQRAAAAKARARLRSLSGSRS